MLWSVFLHLYQPASQAPEVIKNVVESSYRPLLSLLEKIPRARVGLNISACLTEQLLSYGFEDVLRQLQFLAQEKKIEFVGSAKYHSILPLIPENEISFQIKAGLATNKEILGEVYDPVGFFPTELAFDRKVARVVQKMGFQWALADEISYSGQLGKISGKRIYRDKKGLFLIFANRHFIDLIRKPDKLTPAKFDQEIEKLKAKDSFVVTANDAEVFGHHYTSREFVLKKIFRDPGLEPVLITELLERVKSKEEAVFQKGTWETIPEDLGQKRPFALWLDPKNEVQKLYWDLAWFAVESYWRKKTLAQALDDEGKKRGDFDSSSWARRHLNVGLHSCNVWWASRRPWWNPDMIVSGATSLVKVIRTLDLPQKDKFRGEGLYTKIIETVWKWHWSGLAQAEIDRFEGRK